MNLTTFIDTLTEVLFISGGIDYPSAELEKNIKEFSDKMFSENDEHSKEYKELIKENSKTSVGTNTVKYTSDDDNKIKFNFYKDECIQEKGFEVITKESLYGGEFYFDVYMPYSLYTKQKYEEKDIILIMKVIFKCLDYVFGTSTTFLNQSQVKKFKYPELLTYFVYLASECGKVEKDSHLYSDEFLSMIVLNNSDVSTSFVRDFLNDSSTIKNIISTLKILFSIYDANSIYIYILNDIFRPALEMV